MNQRPLATGSHLLSVGASRSSRFCAALNCLLDKFGSARSRSEQDVGAGGCVDGEMLTDTFASDNGSAAHHRVGSSATRNVAARSDLRFQAAWTAATEFTQVYEDVQKGTWSVASRFVFKIEISTHVAGSELLDFDRPPYGFVACSSIRRAKHCP